MNPSHEPFATTASGAGRRLVAFPEAAAGQALFDALPDAVLVLEPLSGEVLQANLAAVRLFGYERAQLVGRALATFAAPGPAAGEEIRARLAAAALDAAQTFEWPLQTADGRSRWTEVTLGAGPPTTAMLRDITARKHREAERARSETELRRDEEQLRLLLGRLPIVAIQACGCEGTVRYWNAASERLYGYSAAEAVGRPLAELIAAPAGRESLRVALHQMLVTGQPLPPAEYQLARREGEPVLAFSGHVVLGATEAEREVYRVDFDLSARHRAEGERLACERQLFHRQKLESLGALAGGVAHDFNNLLTGILGNLELVRSESTDEMVRPWIDEAIAAARRLGHLTAQMLAYAGRSSFQRGPTELNAVIREQAQLLHATTAGQAVLHLALAPELPPVEADAGQVGQLILNLVTNAVEAIEAPPGTIVVQTGLEPDCPTERLAASRLLEKPLPQTFTFIEVSDTGGGMDEAAMQRVFDPFFSTKFAGRGLGLPVVLGIVRAHHGAIFVESLPDRGTTVRVLLPLARPAEDPAAPQPAASATALLLIGGGEATQRAVRECGRQLALETISTPDAATAIALCRLRAEEITCVIVDTDAIADPAGCLRDLREIRPGLAAVGLAADHGGRLEGAASLRQPFTSEDLAAVLQTVAAGAS